MLKSLLISGLIVAVLVILYVRPWTRPREAGPGAEQAFLERCKPIAAARARPEAFCRCLWERGVRSPTAIVTEPPARAAAAECEPSGR